MVPRVISMEFCARRGGRVAPAPGSRTLLEHVEQYPVDPQVAEVLDSHGLSLSSRLEQVHGNGGRHGVWTFPELPDRYVKYGLSRIWGMELMRQVIRDRDLDLLALPEKRIHHLGGRPRQVDDRNYCVVARRVESRCRPRITVEQMRQLIILVRETKYISLTRDNYVHTDQGRLCIIDTESSYDASREVRGYLRLLGHGHDPGRDFTEGALKLLLEELKRLLAREADPSRASRTIREVEGLLSGHPPSRGYATYLQGCLRTRHPDE